MGTAKRSSSLHEPAESSLTSRITMHNQVRKRCSHKSVDKTVRIMLDFYAALCEKDKEIEERIFGSSSEEAAAKGSGGGRVGGSGTGGDRGETTSS